MNPIAALAAVAGLGPSDPVDGAMALPPIRTRVNATKKLRRYLRDKVRREMAGKSRGRNRRK